MSLLSSQNLEANRANAQHSTGPDTPEGKAISSQNARKHGLFSRTIVLPGEDEEEFEAVRRHFLDAVQPATPREELFALQLAIDWWKLARIDQMEAGYFEESRRRLRKDQNIPDPTGQQVLYFSFDRRLRDLTDLINLDERFKRSISRAWRDLTSLRKAAVGRTPRSAASPLARPPELA